jgi:hypothetical protein
VLATAVVIALAGVFVARRAIGQACEFVTPQKYALQLTNVTVDGVVANLGPNECDNTATLAIGWSTAKHLVNQDLEILTIRVADGGAVTQNSPCQGDPLVSEDYDYYLLPDGGADGG